VWSLASDIKGGTWTLFGSKVLRRIFLLRIDEVTRGWRKLLNEDLHKMYSSQSIIRMIE
jgi:hypothetical protein